jgi:hypothetical protein
MSVTIENLVTSGTFSLDGGTWDVDNNVWIVGNDTECVIIDSPHDAAAIINQVRGRHVKAILLTHAHNDHIGAARGVADAVGAPIHLNPADQVLWEQVYPGTTPDAAITDGDEFQVAGPRCGRSTPPATHPAPPASTSKQRTPSSPGTPCSTADPAPPAAPTATTPPSWPPSANASSPSPRKQPSGPDTARTPPSPPNAKPSPK